MTDRKWRIVKGNDRKELYKKIDKYESEGYVLIPESLTIERPPAGFPIYHCFMKKRQSKRI